MFSKLKRILYPENMLFKMIILNCGLLLLVTLVLTAAGNYIYEESIAERSYANTMEIQNQVLKSLDLIFKSVEDNVEALGNYPEVQEYLKVDAENQQASRVELERQVRDLLLDYSRMLLSVRKASIFLMIHTESKSFRLRKKNGIRMRFWQMENWF